MSKLGQSKQLLKPVWLHLSRLSLHVCPWRSLDFSRSLDVADIAKEPQFTVRGAETRPEECKESHRPKWAPKASFCAQWLLLSKEKVRRWLWAVGWEGSGPPVEGTELREELVNQGSEGVAWVLFLVYFFLQLSQIMLLAWNWICHLMRQAHTEQRHWSLNQGRHINHILNHYHFLKTSIPPIQ